MFVYAQVIRLAYLPDVVLAYISVLHHAGHALSRESLLQCMELSSLVASKDSDVLTCFLATGRLTELVTAFAFSSKAMLRANEQKSSKAKGKKRSGMGDSLAIWQVKP